MLNKINRLPGFRFEIIKQKGKLFQSACFALLVLNQDKNQQNKSSVEKNKLKHLSQPRFGFVVSKKISRLAVKRNQIKRLFRQVVKQNLDLFPLAKDYLFLVKTKVLKTEKDKLKEEIKKTLKNVKKNEKTLENIKKQK